MKKLWNDFKPLILILTIFFGSVYIAIRFDQAMGWEKARAEKNAQIRGSI
jgi:hypothetical protein